MGIGLSALRRTLAAAALAWGLWGPIAAQAGDSAQGNKPEPHFYVDEYRVLGNTVLSAREIERVLYPLLGKDKTLTDVEAAKTALEKLYHDRGYNTVFVDIPPQRIEDGVVRLKVTEGRVEREQIHGAHYFAERDVIAALPAATPGEVLQTSKLQAELTAVNRATPDRSVVPILKAGSEPGTVDLALEVNDTLPLHASLELNNQATIDTRPLRSVATVSYDDMFDRLDMLSLQYQTTPQQLDQVRVVAANYIFHTLDFGLQPSLLYVNSNSTVPTAGTLGVIGVGEITGLRLAWALPGEAASVQTLTFGADYKHFRNTINQNATSALNTPITYLNLTLTYAGLWRADWRTTTFSISADAGPRGLVNNSTAFANDRFNGRANYFYLRGDLAFDFKLPQGLRLRLRAAGQAATEPLITNENLSIAGVDAVRGYLESEELGDKGIKGTVQLYSPVWHVNERQIGDLFVFFDAGRDWIIDSLPGEPAGAELRSYGAGLDLLPGQKNLTAGLTWAKALTAASVTTAGSSRVLFFLRGAF